MTRRQGSDASGCDERAGRLIGAVRLQHELYERLERVSAREAEDVGSALAILCERKGIVDALERLAGELGPMLTSFEGVTCLLSDVERADVEATLEETRELMRRVAERDARLHERLSSERDRVGREMAGLSRSRQAMAGYRGRIRHSPQFQDREA